MRTTKGDIWAQGTAGCYATRLSNYWVDHPLSKSNCPLSTDHFDFRSTQSDFLLVRQAEKNAAALDELNFRCKIGGVIVGADDGWVIDDEEERMTVSNLRPRCPGRLFRAKCYGVGELRSHR